MGLETSRRSFIRELPGRALSLAMVTAPLTVPASIALLAREARRRMPQISAQELAENRSDYSGSTVRVTGFASFTGSQTNRRYLANAIDGTVLGGGLKGTYAGEALSGMAGHKPYYRHVLKDRPDESGQVVCSFVLPYRLDEGKVVTLTHTVE